MDCCGCYANQTHVATIGCDMAREYALCRWRRQAATRAIFRNPLQGDPQHLYIILHNHIIISSIITTTTTIIIINIIISIIVIIIIILLYDDDDDDDDDYYYYYSSSSSSYYYWSHVKLCFLFPEPGNIFHELLRATKAYHSALRRMGLVKSSWISPLWSRCFQPQWWAWREDSATS